MATIIAGKQTAETEKSTALFAATALLVVYVLASGALLAMGPRDYPTLHTIVDTAIGLTAGVLALLLWVMGRHVERPFLTWLAIGFAVTSLLELIHLLAIVDWPGSAPALPASADALRAATWGPAAHLLPIAVGGSLWLSGRNAPSTLGFAAIIVALTAGLLAAFQWLPSYTAPAHFGVTRPVLFVAPLLWLGIGVHCWRNRADDRLVRALAWTSPALLLAGLVMLFSQRENDTQAIVAHLGTLVGYLVLLVLLLKLASLEMTERVRAESQLAQLIDEQERRVRERTADLESEVAVRREAEQNAQVQLRRLNLLHEITRAIGNRQDLHSIYQIVVRSLEEQVPVDLSCLCLYDGSSNVLTVSKVGPRCARLARQLGLSERVRLPIDSDALTHAIRGTQVSEPDTGLVASPLSQRLAEAGLRSLVVSPLKIEDRVFGVLIVARRQAKGFSTGKCKFLRQLCEHVALAAHQAELYEAVQQAYQDLQQTQHAVLQQERLRALGQMASGIGHDINNALSPIALHTEALLESGADLSPRVRDSLLTIQRAIDNIAQTVVRMREFYRPRAAESEQAPVQLNPVALQAIDLTRARWHDMPQRRGHIITVKTDLAAELPTVPGIEGEIREALVNLILNAVDAMPNGGTLTLRTKTVPRPHASDAGYVQIDLADTGIGMNDETRRRCMEPFFTTKGDGGSGLGLATVYGVVRRHGAEIDIRSVYGRGTTVSLVFPVQAATETPAATPPRTHAAPERLRLLLVDDDPLFLKSLGDFLEADGHMVTETSSGQGAIDAFRAAHQRRESFSAVITDLGMPYVDGRRVASAVKEVAPSTPVILLTGWGTRLMPDDDIPPNIDRVLSKPPKLRELRQTLGELCKPQVPR
ncbi:ATP-binding protein [Dongia deserti]|uniref:ATP-binding protein n=1 Tax=Dongia deserti TaxID=2268030 RepID=UPI0013C4AA75|nr:ATP-binding protein [Dongia deserti]